ncbi:MAG: transcription-repair coupling factor [Pseudomonadota bacterium]
MKPESLNQLAGVFDQASGFDITSVPDGLEPLVLARLAANSLSNSVAFVARDGQRASEIETMLGFFAPWADVLHMPAWDCLPYDRVSPSNQISARRLSTLAQLAAERPSDAPPRIVVTSPNALIQRVLPRDVILKTVLSARPGNCIEMETLIGWLEANGFQRTSTVRDTGEYAVRGGILDLYSPGGGAPVRLDFFGDTLESIREFDAESQRTTHQLADLSLHPMSEVVLSDAAVSRFRTAYLSLFGGATRDDALYQAVSERRRYAGLEHWLPLFHEQLESVLDYLVDTPVVLDQLVFEAVNDRSDQIADYYEARKSALDYETGLSSGGGTPYKPVPASQLYFSGSDLEDALKGFETANLSAFDQPSADKPVVSLQGRQGRSFAAERTAGNINIFDALISHIADLREAGKTVLIASWSAGARDRLHNVLGEHGLERVRLVDTWQGIEGLKQGETGLVVLELETGFELADLAIISEQDVLGDRLVRKRSSRKKGADYLSEVASLSEGDIVVHVEHGIARFAGLKTVEAAGSAHDCVELHYAGDDKLYLPVENIELLSRYGSDSAEVVLDKLGGVAWQSRKAKLKKRLLDMAGKLIEIAAAREMRQTEPLTAPHGLYDEFAARFPYEETEDQMGAIDSVLDDLSSGRPMDRLVCGDVGFGKTEVALRAAFITAMAGRQVAVVVPTTLLARQHFRAFEERFRGLPVRVAQASRLVGTKALNTTKKELADGTLDIVVGTHALLGKSVDFKRLGLLIIDEEQHFGVKHKERLKELRSDIHVLTLSATPIPRTLQLALTGVRELSLITTAPVDRLAVRTFISPFDSLVVREALLRERYRGGQSFYVCPRVSDLANRKEWLDEQVPELKVAVAHGQMPPGELEDIMNAFYEGQYDVLLSTTIVESGLDIPTANTLVVHRADMFGLAQLYQLRGRVGRSKTRAYAFMTLPPHRTLTATAERRLKVLQSLENLGAGFQLASHDLDIRGSGNLLGEEQSGHIREVGYELYQQMLEEAVAELKEGGEAVSDGRWSPQITIGTTVMIPESYVPDLTLRLGLYRRLAELDDAADIDAFGAELIDRFGPLPEEVDHLLKIVFVKSLCRKANVEKLDAGPRGVVLAFRNQTFPNPAALVQYIGQQGSLAKIRPDQSIVLTRDWPTAEKRLKGSAVVMSQLVKLVE